MKNEGIKIQRERGGGGDESRSEIVFETELKSVDLRKGTSTKRLLDAGSGQVRFSGFRGIRLGKRDTSGSCECAGKGNRKRRRNGCFRNQNRGNRQKSHRRDSTDTDRSIEYHVYIYTFFLLISSFSVFVRQSVNLKKKRYIENILY